jgi:hypothetical protein
VSTDRQLGRDAGRFKGVGVKILLAGLALAAVGVILMLAGSHKSTVEGLGEMLTWLAIAPVVVGLVLLAIAGTARRASQQKPFA